MLSIRVSLVLHEHSIHELFAASGTVIIVFPIASDSSAWMWKLFADFRKRRFQHVLVVTSDYHARRASLVALVTLGGIGIATTTLFVPSSRYANG